MTSLAYLHDCHCCYDERSIVQKKNVFLGDTRYLSHLFSHMGELSIETKRIDDCQSFKRVRHRQKEKKLMKHTWGWRDVRSKRTYSLRILCFSLATRCDSVLVCR